MYPFNFYYKSEVKNFIYLQNYNNNKNTKKILIIYATRKTFFPGAFVVGKMENIFKVDIVNQIDNITNNVFFFRGRCEPSGRRWREEGGIVFSMAKKLQPPEMTDFFWEILIRISEGLGEGWGCLFFVDHGRSI